MRELIRCVSLAGMALLATAAVPTVSSAADLPVIEAPEPMPIAAAVGGWYLRGDIGYKFYKAPKGKLSNSAWGGDGTHSPYQYNNYDEMVDGKMLGAGDFGLGVGYQFNDYLRSDVTIDYETPAKVTGGLYCASADPCNGGSYLTQSAKISAWSALANVYADIADLNGLKPYLGAGAGVSYLRTSSVNASFGGADGSTVGGAGKWNFAWALMAGLSYPLTDQLSVDLGYRYLNLGDAKTTGVTDDYGQTTGIDYKNVQAHEVRLGLRYNLY